MEKPYRDPEINVKLPGRKKTKDTLEEKVQRAAVQGVSYGKLVSAETKRLYARVSGR